jgi:hypothetical protein
MPSIRKHIPQLSAALILAAAGAACNMPLSGTAPPAPTPVATPVPPTSAPAAAAPTAAAPTSPPIASATSEAPIPLPGAPAGEEAILILEPGPGSRVTSPLHVAGIADTTFEQALVVRLVLDDGTLLALEPTTIQTPMGTRGPFEVEVPFELAGERNALLQVYSASARDGGLTHLSSVGLLLALGGPSDIRPGRANPEQLQILRPRLVDRISGGIAHVEGFGLASFEGTLLVQIYDADGNQVGSQSIIVQAPDMGIPGRFVADVPYSVTAEGPGRVVVVDPLPAFDGVGHIASVEVILAP